MFINDLFVLWVMDFILIIGLAAATLTTSAFFPQAVRIWKLKEAKDISLITFIVLSLGVFLWLVYGILKSDIAIILANAVTLVLALTILYFKVKYK
jgi:MtN3 and saliva related transmembrane protein